MKTPRRRKAAGRCHCRPTDRPGEPGGLGGLFRVQTRLPFRSTDLIPIAAWRGAFRAETRPFRVARERLEPAAAHPSLIGMQTDALGSSSSTGTVFFDRRELDQILRLYGFMVAAGEWRDYAIETSRDHVAFAVFRRATESPLFRIEKRPGLAKRQGAWAVTGPGGHTLKRGHELPAVLRHFDRKRFSVVG